MSAGKGDKQRPTDQKKYNDNYDQIDWGKKKEEKKDEQSPLSKPEIVRYTDNGRSAMRLLEDGKDRGSVIILKENPFQPSIPYAVEKDLNRRVVE